MHNLAIITARSGSKGVPDKNIKLLNGIPLMAYSIRTAKESGLFGEIMASTDSEEYAQIAREYGAKVPFLRSEKLSSDTAGSWDAVKEVLENYRKRNLIFDTVCLLQPTSPLRIAEDIIAGYKELLEKQADSITAVCEVDHPPLWTMMLPDDLSMTEFRKRNIDAPRQQLGTFYRVNGALYIRKIMYSKKNINILNSSEYAYIMERKRSVDIDSIDDFEYAEYLIQRNNGCAPQ